MTQQAQPPTTPETALNSLLSYLKIRIPAIQERIAKTMSAERLIRIAYTAATKTPKLLECPPETVYNSLCRAGQLGIEPETAQKHAYLIPRWNNKTRRTECTLQVSYFGLIYVAKRSGACLNVWAETVHENDKFEAPRGHHPNIIHHRHLKAPGDIIAAYAVAVLPGGEVTDALMSVEEIGAIRDATFKEGEKPSGPWATHFGEMAKKTAIIRLMKLLPSGPTMDEESETDDVLLDPLADATAPSAQVTPGSKRAGALLSKASQASRPPAQLPAAEERVPQEARSLETTGEVVSSS